MMPDKTQNPKPENPPNPDPEIKDDQQASTKSPSKNKYNDDPTSPHYKKLKTVVIINNSDYNMEIVTRHHSGARVKSLISSDYIKWVQEYEKKKNFKDPDVIDPIRTLDMHRMYYPEFPLFRLTEADWEKNQGIAYEIIKTKEQESWNDYPEFAIKVVERPDRSRIR